MKKNAGRKDRRRNAHNMAMAGAKELQNENDRRLRSLKGKRIYKSHASRRARIRANGTRKLA